MPSGDYSTYSALVVDDNRSVRDFVKTLLLTMGFGSVKTARDSAQATVFLKAENFDLVLSDAVMPGMDGLGLLALIRNNPVTSKTPFIMISGFPERALASAAAAGVTDFILKPFSIDVFSSKIKSILGPSGVGKYRAQTAAPDVEVVSSSVAVPPVEAAQKEESLIQSERVEGSSSKQPANHFRDQVLSKCGATRVNGSRTIHGNNAGCYFSVFADDAVITRKRIDDILNECAEKRFYKIVVLGFQFEGGIFAAVTQYAKSRGIEIAFKYITVDSIRTVTGFVPATYVGLKSQVVDKKISFQITSFAIADTESVRLHLKLQDNSSAIVLYEPNVSYPLTLAAPLRSKDCEWQSLISCWGVNLNYDRSLHSENFKLDWDSMSTPQKTWRTPDFELHAGIKRVAFFVLDFLGNMSIRVVEVSEEGILCTEHGLQ